MQLYFFLKGMIKAMELEYWKDFIVLSETLSFREAANRLHLSQSALSKRIRVLEDACGGRLFTRTTRRIELSERGRAILPSAMQLAADAARMEKDLHHFDAERSNRLLLGTIRNFQAYGIDDIFLAFEQAYPQYVLNLLEGDLLEVEQDFRERKTNLFCTYRSGDRYGSGGDPDFRFLPVGEGQFGVITKTDDPLTRAESVKIRDLDGCQLLLPARGSFFYHQLLEAFQKEKITYNIVSEGSSFGVLDLVRAGVGVAVQHYELYKSYRYREDLAWKPLVPPIRYEFGLGYRDSAALTGPERAFVTYLRSRYLYSSNI